MTMNLNQKNHFRIGIAPISWVNDDIPGLGDHHTQDQVLSEMAELGYIATEMGRLFMQDPPALKNKLGEYGVQLASKFVSTLFSDASRHEEELSSFLTWIQYLKEMGCEYVIACEMGGSMHWDPRKPAEEMSIQALTDAEWEALVEGLHRAARLCQEHGMELVYHYHAGTVIEQRAEIDRLMEMTDSSLVHLLYDTGHALYGNYDPLELLNKYIDRIKYVHLKDVRAGVLDTVRKEKIDFRSAVVRGMFTVPGDGCIDFVPIFEKLIASDYNGWIIVEAEQDPAVANPYQYSKMAKEYIDSTVSSIKKRKSETTSQLIVPSQEANEEGAVLRITPESAGWKYVGFEVYSLKKGQSLRQELGDIEACLVLLTGRADITTKAEKWLDIGQRMNVFEKIPPYSVYVSAHDEYTVEATTDLELAVCTAPGKGTYPSRLISPDEVGVEIRGAGNIERQIHNILPEQKKADSLLVVEVFTPEGNWSSYPPHKHDQQNLPHESYLEETYFHKVNPAHGFAIQRVYTDDRSLDETLIIKDGDAALVPKGYHPVSAPPAMRSTI